MFLVAIITAVPFCCCATIFTVLWFSVKNLVPMQNVGGDIETMNKMQGFQDFAPEQMPRQPQQAPRAQQFRQQPAQKNAIGTQRYPKAPSSKNRNVSESDSSDSSVQRPPPKKSKSRSSRDSHLDYTQHTDISDVELAQDK